MKAPISWLRDYVDINVDIDTLCKKLVSIGFEVEEVIDLNKTFSGVVVGKILEIEKHPNADKLSVCQVDVGTKTVQIVTNAKNITVGDKVPVSLDGAVLYDGTEIKTGELRGVKSDGMFCGKEELGANESVYIGASSDGVLVLNQNEIVGESMINVLGFNDYILDVGVTPNRPDCNSVLGIAREVAVALNQKCKQPDTSFTQSCETNINDYVNVTVLSPQLCPNYNMQVVTDVKVERSPLWLTRRLNAVGLRGNNNIIDITNYVLMEIGQPMHAFDQKDIRDNTIIVRRAEENEKITPFDKKEYTLNSDVLVIADKNRAVGIAGIMGGVNSGIKNDTTTVAFESAKFLKENIRRTSRLLNLRSDSSARYEKGVDAYTAKFALNRALHLIEELKCGKIVSGKIEIGEETHKRTIEFPLSRIEWLLGIVVPNDEIVKILTNLHINTTINNGNLICGIPEYREDLEQDCDIIEEIIRVYGYDNIIPTLLKKASITKGGETEKQKRTHRMKALFVGEGYQEISTYSFGGNSMYEKLNLDKNSLLNNRIKLKNALGEEFSIMRTTLIGNMLNIIQSNLNKKNSDLKLFEYGRCYYPKQLPLLELPDEVNMLSIGLCGKKYDFYTIMEMIKLMLNEFNIKYTIVRSSVSYLHPGVSADIYVDDFKLGYVGKLHPSVKSNFNIDKEVYVAELNFDAISNHSKLYEKYIPFGRYPTSTRDLALIIDNNILSDDIKNCITNISDLIMNVELFDVYNNIGLIGKKSYAYSITFGCSDRTLKDSEVDSCVAEILETLENKFDAKIRS